MSVAKTIGTGRLSTAQIIILALMVFLNALDGFDVLSISFAAPGIAKEWGVGMGALGWILSMELIGMAIGSIFLGNLADRFGRRPVMLGCLTVMAAGMYLSSMAANTEELLLYRLATGLGIGGLLAAINAVTAEFANDRWRSLAISLMVIGYPLGGAIGGFAVKAILSGGESWRAIFELGALLTFAMIPLIFFFVPESPAFLESKGGNGATEKINKTLTKFGLPPIQELAGSAQDGVAKIKASLFGPNIIATTIILTLAYFFHIMAFYFILKWTPKIVVDLGFAPAAAAGVLAWANFGGAMGGAIFGLLAQKVGLKRLTIIMLFISTLAIIWFGRGASSLADLSIIVAIAGFGTNSAIAGLYGLFAYAFPTELRASGTGFVIGVGRGGSVLAPVAAGYFLEFGFSLQSVAILMGAGSAVAAIVLLFLKLRNSA